MIKQQEVKSFEVTEKPYDTPYYAESSFIGLVHKQGGHMNDHLSSRGRWDPWLVARSLLALLPRYHRPVIMEFRPTLLAAFSLALMLDFVKSEDPM